MKDAHLFDEQDEQHYGEQEDKQLDKLKMVEELAAYYVCPITRNPQTPYEHGAIKYLTTFGLMLLAEYDK